MTTKNKIKQVKNQLSTYAHGLSSLAAQVASLDDEETTEPKRRNLKNKRVANHMSMLDGGWRKPKK